LLACVLKEDVVQRHLIALYGFTAPEPRKLDVAVFENVYLQTFADDRNGEKRTASKAKPGV
jgi:hypothetical protein